VDFLYQTWHGISVANLGSAMPALVIVSIAVVLTLVIGRWAFCHTLCWIAPFIIIGTRIRDCTRLPGLRLKATQERRGACARGCPMSLNAQNEMVARNDMANRECILCGTCADGCSANAIGRA